MAPSGPGRGHIGGRGRALSAAAAVTAVFALVFGGSAAALTLITPSSGPTTGGTTVSIAAATLGFTQVAQGQIAGYGLSGDGHIYAWGGNTSGELGDGGTTTSTMPVRVLQGAIPTGVTITQIAAGWESGYALASNGTLYSWGANFDGQLGDGTTTTRNTPVAVDRSGLGAGVTLIQVAAGALDAYAVGSDGNVYSWGYNHDGELGNGDNIAHLTPVMVDSSGMPGGVRFTKVAGGQTTTFGLGTDGTVYSWGYDVAGALGTGGTGNRNVPTALSVGAIPTGVKMTQVAGGQEGGYALGDNGIVYSWGSDTYGNLGDGTNTDSNVPVQVSAGQIPAGLKMTGIGAGSSSGYAIGTDGKVYAWGNGGNGQLGDGSGSGSTAPILVSAGAIPSNVTITSVSGGYHSAIALGNDGKVYGWGDNLGDLGDGTTTQRATPVLGANVSVTGVTFDGVAGTDVIDPPGVTTVVTPAHAAGVVPMTIAGSVQGGSTAAVATSLTLPAAFTYQAVLAPTGRDFPWYLLLAGCSAMLIGGVIVFAKVHGKRFGVLAPS